MARRFAGKYNYVAPEQLGLAGGEVTAKSDIYSFGLVLAEASRGRPLDMNGSQVEVIEKRRAVPDLSDIDPSMRPLLKAMLQPLPADRPASMAVIADWEEREAGESGAGAGQQKRGKDEPAGARKPGRSWAGRLAGALGVLIVIGSLAGTAYVFRDMAPWSHSARAPAGATQASNTNPQESPVPAPPPAPASTHNPPPLPDLPPGQANGPNLANAEPQRPPFGRAANSPPTPPVVPHVPTADEILQAAGAASHEQNRAEAHASTTAAPPPANPPKPADTQHDSKVALSTAPPSPAPPAAAPPHAPQPFVTMDGAVVGKDYVADLPPFSDSGSSKALVLRADPSLPEGLVFADLGSGFSRISGTPSKPGQYAFEISATNASGAVARMTARIAIAPAAVEAPLVADNPPSPAPPVSPPVAENPPNAAPAAADNPPNPAPISQPAPDNPPKPGPANPSVASLTPSDRAADFMRAFNGGSCFLARPQPAAADLIAIEGIGADKATFERFYGDFIHEIGVEPALTVRLIGSAECPAVDLIRAMGSAQADAPKIDLTGYDAGRGKPLQGTVSNLAGRHIDLLIVSSNGAAYRVDAKNPAGKRRRDVQRRRSAGRLGRRRAPAPAGDRLDAAGPCPGGLQVRPRAGHPAQAARRAAGRLRRARMWISSSWPSEPAHARRPRAAGQTVFNGRAPRGRRRRKPR